MKKNSYTWVAYFYFFAILPFSVSAQGVIPITVPTWQVWTEWADPHSFAYKYFGNKKMHLGADIKANKGDNVCALGNGIVLEVFREGDYEKIGNGVHIVYPLIGKDNQYLYALYAHLCEVPTLKKGQWVSRGQVIGKVGKSGLTFQGAREHLHLELRYFPTIFHPDFGKIMPELDLRNEKWVDEQWENPVVFIPYAPTLLKKEGFRTLSLQQNTLMQQLKPYYLSLKVHKKQKTS
ncbi:MAG: M23 family metallopeptidase [Cytophagales bacterium]|nr:MAG: M23 family metallopeptidase [Cytophagales bacterium]